MSFGALFALALGLSMDAAAVSAARGLSAPRARASDALLLAILFGVFQAVMPVLGWFLGAQFGRLVAAFSHYIAFAILCVLGGKMLYESFASPHESAPARDAASFALPVLLLLAIATSIDAFAAGITLSFMGARLLPASATIGLTTATLSFVSFYAGRRFGLVLGKRLESLGGIVLIALGVKLLF